MRSILVAYVLVEHSIHRLLSRRVHDVAREVPSRREHSRNQPCDQAFDIIQRGQDVGAVGAAVRAMASVRGVSSVHGVPIPAGIYERTALLGRGKATDHRYKWGCPQNIYGESLRLDRARGWRQTSERS